MKKLYTLLLVLGLFSIKIFAQDTVYFFSKTMPITKLLRASMDSMAIKQPTVYGNDSLLIYANGSATPLYRFGTEDLDRI